MRLPRVRFTIRWLMIAVAIVGLVLGGEIIRRRQWAYRTSVAYHASEEGRMLLLLGGGFTHGTDETGKRQRMQIGRNLDREQVRQRWLHHSVMKDRYQRVARFPWLSIRSDPPMIDPLGRER